MTKQHHKSERHYALDQNYPHKPQRSWEEEARHNRTMRGPRWFHWALLAGCIAATLALTLWEVQ